MKSKIHSSNKNNPFKFLDSYQKEDIDIYFGRDKEIDVLFNKVRKSRFTLLYGLSGTGKTSLIQCGLANKFKNSDWFELYIRRNGNIIQSIRDSIEEQADTLIHPKTPLTEALNQLYLDYFRPIYLLFDQFEELFISGTVQEKLDFENFLVEVLSQDELNVKIILVLREEYIAHLDQFEEKIPLLYDSRMRLERMSNDTLLTVIENIASQGGIQIKDKTKVLQQIIDNIANENNEVELPYLQVYLDKLNNLVKENNEKVFDLDTINKVGRLEDVLGAFLEEQVSEIGQAVEDKDLVWAILKILITSEGTKHPLSLEDINSKL